MDVLIGGAAAGPSQAEVAGWSFQTTSLLTVTALGLWVDGVAVTLNHSHDAGLWDSNGSSPLSATIGPAFGNFGSASGLGPWLFYGITPLDLPPGAYVLGATDTADDADGFRMWASLAPPLGITTVAGLTVLDGRAVNSTTLAFPNLVVQGGGQNGFFGPNLLVSTASEAPEPATLWPLALALGLMAQAGRRPR